MRGLRAPGTGALSYGYDANGQHTSLRYPDGTRLSYAYWPDGRLAAYAIALSAQTLAGVAISTTISSATRENPRP